jgi:hypothetical protein
MGKAIFSYNATCNNKQLAGVCQKKYGKENPTCGACVLMKYDA